MPQARRPSATTYCKKFAYLAVIFFFLPLMILMGLGMSPALDALSPGWVHIFFGRQFVRTIHFAGALRDRSRV
jgi:thiosulfate reductase cytochrome b subunit